MTPSRGSLLLTEYLEARRIRRTEFAKSIGLNRAFVTMWCNGTHRPTEENRRRVRHATHGLVPMRSWDEPLVSRRSGGPAGEPSNSTSEN